MWLVTLAASVFYGLNLSGNIIRVVSALKLTFQ